MVTHRPFPEGGTRSTAMAERLSRRISSPRCGDFPVSEVPLVFTFRINTQQRVMALSILQLGKIIHFWPGRPTGAAPQGSGAASTPGNQLDMVKQRSAAGVTWSQVPAQEVAGMSAGRQTIFWTAK